MWPAIFALTAASLASPADGQELRKPGAPPSSQPAACDPGNVVQRLSEAVAQRPDDPERRLALAQAYVAAGELDRAQATVDEALRRFPDHLHLHLTWIDVALAQRHYSTALERIRQTVGRWRPTPELHYRAAQAYFHLGRLLGGAAVRRVPGGRAGQFAGGWLLVEARQPPGSFLCCPRQSALYQLRQALDGGLEQPAAYVLHARIWQRIGRPQIGLLILKARAAVLLNDPDDETLAAFSELSLAADALADFLRYERLRAARSPQRRDEILCAACLTAAERYGQRGEQDLHIHWLGRAAQLRPQDAELMLRLADAEWTAGRIADAARHYRRLLELKPHHPQRAHALARLVEASSAAP